MYLDNISDEFEGHRSKVNVAMFENVNFRHFLWDGLCRLTVESRRDVMA